MPKASRESAARRLGVSAETGEGVFDELDGFLVCFDSFPPDGEQPLGDAARFDGLPDNRCQCPHWGYVLEGRKGFRFADREEIYEAGDAYYAPPGHVPLDFPGGVVVEFSPTVALLRTWQVVYENGLRRLAAESPN